MSGLPFSADSYHRPFDGLDIRYAPDWLPAAEASALASTCDAAVSRPGGGFRPRATRRLYGRSVERPRDTAWFSANGRPYAYGGSVDRSDGWPVWIRNLAARVATDRAWRFDGAPSVAPNVALLNVYRDGSDYVDWHADDEPEVDQRSPIASLSLGGERVFRIRPAVAVGGRRLSRSVRLEPLSLLVMPPGFQSVWQHTVPRSARAVGRRWNLTFRVYGPGR